MSLGSLGPFPAHQTVSPGVSVRTLLLQEVVDAGGVAKTRHCAYPDEEKMTAEEERCEVLRVRIHLAGKSLNQLGDKLLHQGLALLGDQPNRDQVAGAVKHLPQFLLLE